ncbi:MAG TPA: formate/nitrite transporter family protein [Xanthobacteraceae bacterium]|jgi:formate/nitrite transporter FocA (FNT family)|nr:formate/nitrite transporter family protein [Xanthobacteraceae bacterium]
MARRTHRKRNPDKSGRSAAQDDRTESSRQRITNKEVADVEERSSPSTPVIYEIVRRVGEEEMARPATSLWWSGVAAGLSISFSLLMQTILETHLPDTPWRPLISSFGYTVGFVMVVLSRQQLFTENTITVVLPVMADFTLQNILKLCRMWAIVLAANMAGTLFAALFCNFTPVLTPDLWHGMLDISRHLMEHSWLEMLFRGIAAGFLVAAMVWLLPSAEAAQFHVIIMLSYLIAVGGFVHIVAGSIEAFLLVLNGDLNWLAMLTDFFAPALIGNIIGGTALFALIAYAQVMKEI